MLSAFLCVLCGYPVRYTGQVIICGLAPVGPGSALPAKVVLEIPLFLVCALKIELPPVQWIGFRYGTLMLALALTQKGPFAQLLVLQQPLLLPLLLKSPVHLPLV